MVLYIDNVVDWEQLKEAIAHDRLHELARSKAVYDEYVKHVTKVKREYCTIKDYIQIRFLGYPHEEIDATDPTDPTISKKKQAIASSDKPVPLATLFPNDFPYFFPPNVDHLIMWCTRPLTPAEINSTLPQLLQGKYGDAQIEVQHFTNPGILQSIKEIFHVHIIVKRNV